MEENPQIVDVLWLVARYDAVNREMPHHDLKYATKHFGVAEGDRPELSPEEIATSLRQKEGESWDVWREWWDRFTCYLASDLLECERLYQKLVPPYIYLAEVVNAIIKAESSKIPRCGLAML